MPRATVHTAVSTGETSIPIRSPWSGWVHNLGTLVLFARSGDCTDRDQRLGALKGAFSLRGQHATLSFAVFQRAFRVHPYPLVMPSPACHPEVREARPLRAFCCLRCRPLNGVSARLVVDVDGLRNASYLSIETRRDCWASGGFGRSLAMRSSVEGIDRLQRGTRPESAWRHGVGPGRSWPRHVGATSIRKVARACCRVHEAGGRGKMGA